MVDKTCVFVGQTTSNEWSIIQAEAAPKNPPPSSDTTYTPKSGGRTMEAVMLLLMALLI